MSIVLVFLCRDIIVGRKVGMSAVGQKLTRRREFMMSALPAKNSHQLAQIEIGYEVHLSRVTCPEAVRPARPPSTVAVSRPLPER